MEYEISEECIKELALSILHDAAIIDDGHFRWAVSRDKAELWAQKNLGRKLRSTERWSEEQEAAFCRDVPPLIYWDVGGREMILLCRYLYQEGAPWHDIAHLPEQEDD